MSLARSWSASASRFDDLTSVNPLRPITAVVLAGGLGTRLRSVVPDKPKVLAEVAGRPFLEYLLEKLADEGIQNVVLCTGFKAEQVEERFGNHFQNLRLSYSREIDPLGTGGALRLALPLCQSSTLLVLNGDSFCDAAIEPMFQRHSQQAARGTLMLVKTDDVARFGSVRCDAQERITAFEEKAQSRGAGWINAGVYLLHRDLIASIAPDRAVSLEREMFPRWVGNGLYGFAAEGRLWDIGIPEAYDQAKTDFSALPPSPHDLPPS